MSAIPEINRAEMNRTNAQHSTGPQPEAGIQKSCLGAMRYTLGTEQLVVSPDEDRELYHLHRQTFRDDYQPQGATEEHLVQSLADLSWRLNRVVALETNILSMSYSLRDLADGLFDQTKALANLSLHSQRLSRQFERTVAQLRGLQQTRRSQEQRGLDNLLDIMEVHEEKGQTYNPSEDDFVFSPSQITRAIQARRRDRLLDETHRAAA
jgi:hypothetical protein